MSTYNICSGTFYITATQGGGTIFFQPLYSSDNPMAPGQTWSTGDNESNTLITCQYPDGSQPLYLTADTNSEGSYVGATEGSSNNSYWSIESDGSLQLISNDSQTGLYAIIADSGILTLSSASTTKWKFTKAGTKGGTR